MNFIGRNYILADSTMYIREPKDKELIGLSQDDAESILLLDLSDFKSVGALLYKSTDLHINFIVKESIGMCVGNLSAIDRADFK